MLAAGPGNAASIAFDLRGLSAEEYRRIDGLALERKLVLRLVQEGFAVVGAGSGADLELKAFMTAAGLELRATSYDSSRVVTISTVAAPSAEWQLEVTHKISELARALTPVKRAANQPSLEPPRPEPPKAPEKPQPKPRWEVGLGAGAVWRAGGAGLLAGLNAANSLGRLRLHLDVLGTRSQGTDIEVWEAQGSAGVGVTLIDHGVGLEVGLAGGAVIQRFSVESQWASARGGTSASPAVWAPLYVRWATSNLSVAGRTALGLARAPAHTSEGATLWSRGSLRVEAILIVAWAL